MPQPLYTCPVHLWWSAPALQKSWHWHLPTEVCASSLLQQATHCKNAKLHLTVVVEWDIERYTDSLGNRPTGTNEVLERRIEDKWAPVQPDGALQITRPSIILDEHNKILAWCLPFILSQRRQVFLHKYTCHDVDQFAFTGSDEGSYLPCE